MTPPIPFDRVLGEPWLNPRAVLGELLAQAFTPSDGHLTAMLSGCLFPRLAPLRLVAYRLLVPSLLLSRIGVNQHSAPALCVLEDNT